MLLTDRELADLTHRLRPRAQALALSRMGIRFVCDPDGRPRVLRAEVERVMLSSPVKREPALRVAGL